MGILAQYEWHRFHIDPWWTDHRDLEYINEPFNDARSIRYWRSAGFTQEKFTGDMYDMRFDEPAWIGGFRDYFPWRHFSWSVYRMSPGCCLPNHSDTYARFRKLHKIKDSSLIFRAVVFLEDWESGHYFEIDQTPVVNWQAGDGVIWRDDCVHTAANFGFTDRYTLQITGVPDEDIFVQRVGLD